MTRAARIAACCLVALLGACGRDDYGNQVIGGYTCGENSTGTSDQSDEVTGTIGALVPDAAQADVHCTGKQKFRFQDRDVFLVYVGYGDLNDCPAGCFFSNLCAIYDASQAQLYTAIVQGQGEQPKGVPSDCAVIHPNGSNEPDSCAYQAPGQSHPVVQTSEFQSYRDAQAHSPGPLSACFY